MTVPMMCVFAAFGLIYAAHVPGLVARAMDEGGFDNRNPRRQQAGLEGFGARAIGGHANAHEGATAALKQLEHHTYELMSASLLDRLRTFYHADFEMMSALDATA